MIDAMRHASDSASKRKAQDYSSLRLVRARWRRGSSSGVSSCCAAAPPARLAACILRRATAQGGTQGVRNGYTHSDGTHAHARGGARVICPVTCDCDAFGRRERVDSPRLSQNTPKLHSLCAIDLGQCGVQVGLGSLRARRFVGRHGVGEGRSGLNVWCGGRDQSGSSIARLGFGCIRTGTAARASFDCDDSKSDMSVAL